VTEFPDLAAFEQCRGDEFRLRPDEGESVPLVLDQVTALGDGRPRPGLARQEPFSLLFRGPPGFAAPQRIWPLEHDRLGELRIFLVPVGQDQEGRMRFEAIFN